MCVYLLVRWCSRSACLIFSALRHQPCIHSRVKRSDWKNECELPLGCLVEVASRLVKLRVLGMSDSMAMGALSLDTKEYHTALAVESEHATSTSSPQFFSTSNENINDECLSVEELIGQSKSHWSELSTTDSTVGDEDEKLDNLAVFKSLQMHPTWGTFFKSFGHGEDSKGELMVGKKFAEGGQAELYEVQIKWQNPEWNEQDLKEGREHVLKAFKKGTLLRHLQCQWPQGLLQFHVEITEHFKSSNPRPLLRHNCDVMWGTLMEDGRFGFIMRREMEDMRSLINRIMLTSGHEQGPFSKENVEFIMYLVAQGVDWLHRRNIVHRDLKASNVLFGKSGPGWNLYVADFECSIGVVGTGFFRAPEILQACKEKTVSQRPELFSKAADVYSYGMTCYEILTGKLPFEGHAQNDYNLVLKGQRPELPNHIDGWICELLSRCWEFHAASRPSIGEILNMFLANAPHVREDVCKENLRLEKI